MDELTNSLSCERKEYETLFCACSFINPQAALEKCSYLEPSDFIDPDMSEYWKKLKEHGDPMRAAGEAHVISELSGASTEIPSSLFPENYANEIQRHKYLMDVSSGLSATVRAISERDDILVRDNVAKLHTMARNAAHEILLPSDISNDFIQRIHSQSPSILTGIDDVDALLGGLFVGELTILAGRPGIGKTSIVTAIAQNVATKGAKVLFFSLEMDKIQLWARMACAKTPYSWKEIRGGRADAATLQAIETASRELEKELGENLIIEDRVWDVPTMISICAQVRPSLVVVDHLGEIRWRDDNADEIKWFGRAAKLLRTEIARRMGIPLILLHQLSRDVEGRGDNKVPILKDLKWSGDLEAIADTVIMLYRDDYYDDKNMHKPSTVPMEVWIRKNRQGVMNSCAVVNFDTRTQKFSPARAPSYNSVNLTKLVRDANEKPMRLDIIDNTEQM